MTLLTHKEGPILTRTRMISFPFWRHFVRETIGGCRVEGTVRLEILKRLAGLWDRLALVKTSNGLQTVWLTVRKPILRIALDKVGIENQKGPRDAGFFIGVKSTYLIWAHPQKI